MIHMSPNIHDASRMAARRSEDIARAATAQRYQHYHGNTRKNDKYAGRRKHEEGYLADPLWMSIALSAIEHPVPDVVAPNVTCHITVAMWTAACTKHAEHIDCRSNRSIC
jgi:hypothetical protein